MNDCGRTNTRTHNGNGVKVKKGSGILADWKWAGRLTGD